jgi:hypothetical protein
LYEALAGTFKISFQNEASEDIPVDASAEELKLSLEKLGGVWNVQ